MSYQVKLDVFEGPFDLLLQLIARRQVEVTDIDLADITADFVAHLDQHLEELDLDTATRFLVVAATLIELKAARLLPVEEREELEDLIGEARDVLYARLLEYRAFRDVARVLDHRLHQHEALVAREVPLEPWIQRLVPQTPLPIDVQGLAALAASAMAPEPDRPVDLSHIRRSYLTIREAALQVLDALPADDRSQPFRDLVAGRARGDRVVLFLAVLELFKLGHVDLQQPDHRGPLDVLRREGGADLDDIVEDEDDDEDADDAPNGAAAADPTASDAAADDRAASEATGGDATAADTAAGGAEGTEDATRSPEALAAAGSTAVTGGEA